MILGDLPSRLRAESVWNEAALQSIMNSHWLPEIAQKINEKLTAEAALRERFYDEVTESQKAEFIDGAVIVHSPGKMGHIEVSGRLLRLLGEWGDKIGGKVMAEKALCVFTRNAYEPDLVYFMPEKCSGLDKDTMKFPVPDFIVEILSESTEKSDRGVKFADYAAHGVKEYWIVDPRDSTLEQYLLGDQNTYKLKLKSAAGDVTSEVLAGLTLPIGAIFDAGLFRKTLETLMK
jgi:Uma2 family endonuclease